MSRISARSSCDKLDVSEAASSGFRRCKAFVLAVGSLSVAALIKLGGVDEIAFPRVLRLDLPGLRVLLGLRV